MLCYYPSSPNIKLCLLFRYSYRLNEHLNHIGLSSIDVAFLNEDSKVRLRLTLMNAFVKDLGLTIVVTALINILLSRVFLSILPIITFLLLLLILEYRLLNIFSCTSLEFLKSVSLTRPLRISFSMPFFY